MRSANLGTWRHLRRSAVHRLQIHRIHLTRSREVAILRRWLAQYPCHYLLDIGCGDGFWTSQFATMVPQAIGIDYDATVIEMAQSLHASKSLSFAQGSALTLPLPDDSIDRAVCLCALQNFPDPVAALQELGRVVTPGGLIALSVDSLLAPEWVTDEYRQYHSERFETGRAFDLTTLSHDLEQAGFEVLAHQSLLRSRFAAFWAMQQERLDWSINWWFPVSWTSTWLADAFADPGDAGLILAVLARKTDG